MVSCAREFFLNGKTDALEKCLTFAKESDQALYAAILAAIQKSEEAEDVLDKIGNID